LSIILRSPPRHSLFPYTTLFRSLEFPGEKIIHHQRGDESGDPKILLRIVVEHVKSKFIAAAGESREKLVHRKFLFVCPLANRIQDRKSTRLNSSHLVISYAVFCL